MEHEELDAFRAHVGERVELARRLRDVPPEHFIAEATRLANEAGYDVSEDDLRQAVSAGSQSWAMRWLK